MQEGLKRAVEVPYQTALGQLRGDAGGPRNGRLTGHGGLDDRRGGGLRNRHAGVRGGIWNVLVNLKGMQDPAYVKKMRDSQCDELLEKATRLLDETAAHVMQNWRRPLSSFCCGKSRLAWLSPFAPRRALIMQLSRSERRQKAFGNRK